jgi:thiol-disulfide isomerase/thioredoxin
MPGKENVGMNRLLLCSVLACVGATLAFAEGLPIGAKVDKVVVQDLKGNAASFNTAGQTTAVIFISTQCPVSNDYNERMIALYKDYTAKGVKIVFVNANSNESAADVAEHAKASQFTFPVYKDATGALAERFGATVTPEAFVFDGNGVLNYRGNIDDSRNAARVKVSGLRDALDSVLAGKNVAKQETKAFGCTIKRARKTS